MTIASKVNTFGSDYREVATTLLLEPENAEATARIITEKTGSESAREFAQLLSIIRGGITEQEHQKAICTLNLLIELSFLQTSGYSQALSDFINEIEGRASPDDARQPIESTENTAE